MSKMWNKKYTITLIVIILVPILLYGGLYITMIKPLIAGETQAEQEVNMYETTYERMVQNGEDIQGQDELQALTILVPNEKAPDTVLSNLNSLADKAQVTISYVDSQDGTKQDTPQTEETSADQFNRASYSVELTAKNLQSVNSFLKSMLDSDRLLTIDSLDLTQNQDDVFANLTFTTFYTKQ